MDQATFAHKNILRAQRKRSAHPNPGRAHQLSARGAVQTTPCTSGKSLGVLVRHQRHLVPTQKNRGFMASTTTRGTQDCHTNSTMPLLAVMSIKLFRTAVRERGNPG